MENFYRKLIPSRAIKNIHFTQYNKTITISNLSRSHQNINVSISSIRTSYFRMNDKTVKSMFFVLLRFNVKTYIIIRPASPGNKKTNNVIKSKERERKKTNQHQFPVSRRIVRECRDQAWAAENILTESSSQLWAACLIRLYYCKNTFHCWASPTTRILSVYYTVSELFKQITTPLSIWYA